jgi:hypothetical protein
MNKEEMDNMLKDILDEEVGQLDPPSPSDWKQLEVKFNCSFNEEFRYFIELMAKYSFPGDILNVSTGTTNGNDTIEFTFNDEMNQGRWNTDFIPFYSIGNGDYFCLNSRECPHSSVFYFYHEDYRVEKYSNSFTEWLEELPKFLE